MSVPLDEVQWRSPEWIQINSLRTENVLDYFALSPFYDRSSNNQVLKMQSSYNEHFRTDTQKALLEMKGIEFSICLAKEPELWVIRKQNRLSPTEAEIMATYFVAGDNIYQAPSVYAILASRVLATSQLISKALNFSRGLVDFSLAGGYAYRKTETDHESDQEELDGDDALAMERSIIVSQGPVHYL